MAPRSDLFSAPKADEIDWKQRIQWILSSAQITDVELIQVLLAEIYAPTYQHALSLCDDPRVAHILTRRALALAVHQRHKYWGEPELQAWINAFVDQLSLSLAASPDNRASQPAESPAGDEASPLPAGAETGEDPSLVRFYIERCLAALRKKDRQKNMRRGALLSGLAVTVAVALLWLAGIRQIIPWPRPVDPVRYTYSYALQEGDTLEIVARLSGLSPEEIRQLNRLDPGQEPAEGATLKLVALRPDWWHSLLLKLHSPVPLPLGLRSSSAEIRKRIENSQRYWSSLWVDAATLNYGPPGYLAPPTSVIHMQAWLRRPQQELIIQAQRGAASPASVYTIDGNRSFSRDVLNSYTYTQFISDAEREKTLSSLPFARQNLPAQAVLQAVGMEEVAGRQALVVDQMDASGVRQARLWVDTKRGLILAQRVYSPLLSGTDQQPVLQDIIVNKVSYDLTIQDKLFNPNMMINSLAKDASGAPQENADSSLYLDLPILRYAPSQMSAAGAMTISPARFDPRQSRLEMRLQSLYVGNPIQVGCDPNLRSACVPVYAPASSEHLVTVSADGFYLGSFLVPLGGDEFQINNCTRSPDGSRVAINAASQFGARVYWFNMLFPDTLYPTEFAGSYSSQMAFSPSSRKLALSLYRWVGWEQKVNISLLDLGTNQVRETQTLPWATYILQILWSPDGDFLAAVTYRYLPKAITELYIFDANSLLPIYHGPYDYENNLAAPDAPLQSWGASFDPRPLRNRGCLLPSP